MIVETTKDGLSLLLNFYYKSQDKLLKKTNLTNNQYISLTAAATATFVLWKLYKKNSKKNTAIDSSLLPPLVKGGVPILGNLLDLEKDPRQFIDSARDSLGPCFRINMPGQGNLVVVTGSLIGEVMRNTKNFNFSLGIESIVPAAKVVRESYQHKFKNEDISPRAKHPSKVKLLFTNETLLIDF